MTKVRFTRKGIILLFFVLIVLGGIGTFVVVRLNQANTPSNAGNDTGICDCLAALHCPTGTHICDQHHSAGCGGSTGPNNTGCCCTDTPPPGDGDNGICEISDCTFTCSNGGVTNLHCNSDCKNPRPKSKDVCRGGGGGTCQLCQGINGNKCGPTGPNDDVSCTKSCECFPTGDPGLKTCYEEGPPYSDGTLNCRHTQQDIIADRNPDGTIPYLGDCKTDGADWDTCFPSNNPPLCRSLVVTGGTGTGQNRVVDENQEMVFKATGYDPDGSPTNISICYTIAGQPTAFYSATTPINPWICQTSTTLIRDGADYSFTIRSREQQLNFANMRAAIIAKLTQFTAAQVNTAGITFSTNIADNTSASIFCSTNPGYNNGAGVLINNGQNAGTCDGDTCVAKLTLTPTVLKTCFQTGCIAAGGCTGTGVTCDQTLDKCVNVACPTDSDCVCPTVKTCFQTGCIAAGGCTGTGVTCDQTLDKCVNAACPTDSDCVCPQNPNWNVVKTPIVSCVDDSMATSTARITYNLDVTYTSPDNTAGTLSRVVDRPEGIRAEWVDANAFVPAGAVVTASTTNPGFVDNITWNLTGAGATFTPNTSSHTATKRFTYVLNIPAGTNGINYKTYNNTVSIYGTSTTPLDTDTATVPLSCIPFTGIFDEVWTRIGLGGVLLVVGIVYVGYQGSDNVISKSYNYAQSLLFKDAQVRYSQSQLEEKILSKKKKSKK